MGQTLTHGVYLPDEGERNCYSGLAANWQLLDGAVGTIAEHTSALAGKAPLVHTHTKSDITDLFNSANVWRAKNTYSADCIVYNSDNSGSVPGLKLRNSKAEILSTGNTTSDQSMTFRDKNDVAIGYVKGAVQSNGVALKIGSYAKDSSNNTVNTELQLLAYSNGNKAIFPSTTDAYNLGTSSYQWNNLYAKNYYYNGTAWGLDQNNTWTGANSFTSVIKQRINSVYSQIPATDRFAVHEFLGTDDNRIFTVNCADRSSGQREMSLIVYDTDGTFKASGIFKESDGTFSFRPRSNNEINLGTSTNKWKTLNGINPGALCFPATATADASGDIVPPSGESSINLSGGANTYTPSNNGWLTLAINCASGNCIIVRQNTSNRDTLNYMQGYVPGQANIYLTIPVLAGVTYYIFLYATSFVMARFALCQSNV